MNSEKIKHGKQTIEVRELTIGQMFPIMELMGDQPQQGQIALLSQSVHINDKAVGEAGLNEIGASALIALVEAAMRVNGMDTDDAGNA